MRKAMFVKHYMAYIGMAGGFGIIPGELCDMINQKKRHMPIILFNTSFFGVD